MGLARIAIAVLAVVLALGLLIVGGTALWGALTKDSAKTAAPAPSTSASSAPVRHSKPPPVNPAGNVIQVQCLVAQCPIFVAGPGPTDVIFHNTLSQGATREFNQSPHMILSVDDASTVLVTINGRRQPRGRPGESKVYEVPAGQR